jgi:alpha-L-fucosidase
MNSYFIETVRPMNRWNVLSAMIFFSALVCAGICFGTECDWSKFPTEKGEFDSSWESLEKYDVPEWFKDAKFGIWAIIGPQAVPMEGDWYARNMYTEGHAQYKAHIKKYGHPSEFGYKDIISLFKPAKLDYDKLVGMYKNAGAKYAVILAVHHDNFDLWNSKHHEWNSVKKGPKRDLVGEFRDATLKHDLRFGVTTHLARSYSWLQTSKKSDKKGPKAGVPYDGADPKYESLYHRPFKDSYVYPVNPPEEWQLEWYLRVKDLIDSYQPDLLYFDGSFPFDSDGIAGRRLVSHYYNANAKLHEGNNEAAMCIKKHTIKNGAFRDGTCVLDIERGSTKGMSEQYWQTDTCIGGWYYTAGTKYKTVGDVARMMLDIVSKNGNLLLNIPLHPNGSIDAEEEAFLVGIGKWMDVNGQGIYGTRPWLIFGEGPSLEKSAISGHFGGVKDVQSYLPGDLRFICKGENELYAFMMAWPQDNTLTIRSLAKPLSNKTKIQKVSMLGHSSNLGFQQTSEGLVIELPETKPCEHAWGIRIDGMNLKDFATITPGSKH